MYGLNNFALNCYACSSEREISTDFQLVNDLEVAAEDHDFQNQDELELELGHSMVCVGMESIQDVTETLDEEIFPYPVRGLSIVSVDSIQRSLMFDFCVSLRFSVSLSEGRLEIAEGLDIMGTTSVSSHDPGIDVGIDEGAFQLLYADDVVLIVKEQ